MVPGYSVPRTARAGGQAWLLWDGKQWVMVEWMFALGLNNSPGEEFPICEHLRPPPFSPLWSDHVFTILSSPLGRLSPGLAMSGLEGTWELSRVSYCLLFN